ncbi:hypothetical protein ACOMHN_000745 [Nucella lapillus]
MASSAGLTDTYLHTCSFCSLIEQGKLQEVKKLLAGQRDPCRCFSKRPVYRLIGFYQRFLRDSRPDSVPKAQVWRTPAVFLSPTRALVMDVCAKLLAAGAAVNYTTGVETPLMAALSTCDEELLWLLLEFKADVNLCDGLEDMNALGLAILLNEVPLVQILLKHGAKVNSLCCGNLVPIQLAMNKNAAMSNLLIQQGADVHQLRTVSLDDRVFTSQFPLHVAILRKNVHLGRLLLDHGEDVNQTFNDTLESPIHQAVRNQDLDMIDLLIEYGADLNRPNAERHTPVGLALVLDDPIATDIAKRLILAGASANQRTRISYFQKTYSPLHIACFKGNLDFVRFLVEEVCVRVGFWDEDATESPAPTSSLESEIKKIGQEALEKFAPRSKPHDGVYIRLLPRSERLWGSTPSSSQSGLAVRQGASPSAPTPSSSSPTPTTTPTPPTFLADTQAYRTLVGRGSGRGVVLPASDQTRNLSGRSSSAKLVGGETSTTGGVCNACKDGKDNHRDTTVPGGGVDTTAAAPLLPASSSGEPDAAATPEEVHSIVFVVGGETSDRPTAKDQWLEPDEEDATRCNCCEFCISPDVLSSAVSTFVVNRGVQTDGYVDDAGSLLSSLSIDAPAGVVVVDDHDSERGAFASMQGSLASEENPGGESAELSSTSDDDDDEVDPASFVHHRATQTPPHRPAQQHHTTTTTTTSTSTTTTTTTTQGADSTEPLPPVFQAEFGAPDYDLPPEAKKMWQKLEGDGVGRSRVKSHNVERFLNQVGNDGSTALFMAVYDGNVHLVDYLLRNGADPYFSSQHGNFFHAAVLSQCLPLLHRALGLHCDINEVNLFGNSPLILISRLDMPEACEVLVTHGADMNSRDRYGETPLLASVYFGCEMNARTLIQHGAELDLVDENHTSAIYWSIFNNRQRTLKLLLMAGVTFTPQVFRQYPRNIRVMSNRSLFHFIHHYVHQPRSLQDLASISVRRHLGRVRQGCSILAPLEHLPLPNRLKDILRLKHFIEAIEAEA